MSGRGTGAGGPGAGGSSAVGILGGTFDPIHVGHLAIAESVREELGLDRVVFIPAAVPPHRTAPAASAEDRAAMVELAIAGNPAFVVDRLELERPGPSYAVDTLEILAAREPDPWFILSAEALAGLPSWRSPRRVIELARLAVVPRLEAARLEAVRPGAASPSRAWVEEQFPGCGDRVSFLDGPLLPISGTAIRERLAAGRSVRYLVPDAVRGYIVDHGLYRT